MEAAARLAHTSLAEVVFEDGLGQRSRLSDPAGAAGIEVLTLRPSFAIVPSFEFALRERAGRLALFRHASYLRVRSVERSAGVEPLLRVLSDAGQGLRLSELLAGAHARQVPIDINAALCLVRQLVPAVAMLHESAKEVAHGAIGIERLMVTPQARLLIVEYILGAGLEQLRYSRERHWNELRIPLPQGAGPARFDHRSDVLQIGVAALSLILGRPLRLEEFPNRIADVVASTWAVSPRGGFEPLPPGLRGWLGRALQIDPVRSFQSAVEARAELDAVLGDSELVASPASLEAFLTRYHASTPVLEVAPPTVYEAPPAPPVAAVPHSRSTPSPAKPAVPPLPPTPIEEISETPEILALATPPDIRPTEPSLQPVPTWTADETADASRELADEENFGSARAGWKNWRVLGAAAAVVAVVAAGGYAAWRPAPAPAVHAASGTLEISTNPDGAEALIDGVLRGTTPLVLALEPGAHTLELRGGGDPRTIPITINAGMKVSQYVELARGVSVARATAAPPQPLSVPASSTAVPPPATDTEPVPPRPIAREGSVSLDVPFDVQVFEDGSLVGTGAGPLTLPAGRHELNLVNSELGVRTSVVAQVSPGRATAVKVQLPTGVLSMNALPWAEVWLDGEKIGETPIGNLQVRVGTHDVVFRNPDLGERHVTTVVTAKEPTRLSVDLRSR